MDALEAPDDKTLVFRLKQAVPPRCLRRWRKPSRTPAIMPERIGELPIRSNRSPRSIGSGPFRFVPTNMSPATCVVFAKNDRYNPRDETGELRRGRLSRDGRSGGVAHHSRRGHRGECAGDRRDRLAGNAAARSAADAAQGLRRRGRARSTSTARSAACGRTTAGPDRQSRRAPRDARRHRPGRGDDRDDGRGAAASFAPRSASSCPAHRGPTMPAWMRVRKRNSIAEIKAMLKAAGYNGEKVVLHASDRPDFLRRHERRRRVVAAFRQSKSTSTSIARLGHRRRNVAPATSRSTRAAGRSFPTAPRPPSIAIRSSPPTCAATARMPGSAGPTDRQGGSDAQPRGWTATTKLSANGSTRRSRRAPSRPCRSFRSASTCRPPPGAAISPALLKGAVPVFWNVATRCSASPSRTCLC